MVAITIFPLFLLAWLLLAIFFTKVMKQLVKRWRSFGIHTIPYLDDFSLPAIQ